MKALDADGTAALIETARNTSLFVPISQARSVMLMTLLEPKDPDALVSWGFFNTAFERKEYMEAYVAVYAKDRNAPGGRGARRRTRDGHRPSGRPAGRRGRARRRPRLGRRAAPGRPARSAGIP